MWTKKASLYASLVITVIIFIAIVTSPVYLPRLLANFVRPFGFDGRENAAFSSLLAVLFASALPGLLCDLTLFALLMNIRAERVFVARNVTYLRVLSWCCFLVGAEYLLFSFRYQFLSLFFIAFAALFVGMILRVIKNVFDQAIALREENDYTI